MRIKLSIMGLMWFVTLAEPAAAQSSVTISGAMDLGVTRGTANGPGSTNLNSVTSGNNVASKLVFRGTEDLGGGWAASFWLENQTYADTGAAGREGLASNQGITTARGSGMNFTRRSTLSLSTPWGEARLGRDWTPSFYNLAILDPFNNAGVGTSLLVLAPSNGLNSGTSYAIVPNGQGSSGPISRVSNQISYFTPSGLGGLYGQLSYWLGENARNGAVNEDDGTGKGLRLGYKAGRFDVSAGWSMTAYRGTPVATTAGAPSGDLRSWNVGGQYDFGVVKAMATYSRDARLSAVRAEGRGYLVGAILPLGVQEVRASYADYKITGGTSLAPQARVLSVGYIYNFSKRTALYSTLAHARNHDGSRLTLGGSTFGAGIANGRSTGFDLGMRVFF